MRILNFGSLNLDYVYRVKHFVRAGETLSAASQTMKAGGKGLNQSIALSKAGADVWHAGCLGRGGEPLRQLLRQSGVHDEFLVETDVLQGNAIIQVNEAGENCILLYGGSNQCLTEEQIDRTLACFSAGDWLILQNEVNLVPTLVEKAYEKGLRVVLNPSPFDEKLDDVDFGKLDWILMNEIEAKQMTGCREPDAAWDAIHARYPKLSALITLGSEGSVAWQVNGGDVRPARQRAIKVEAVDTTAAGDTYTGYFVSGLIGNRPLAECMARAARASSIAVTRPGAAESIPESREVD